MHDLLGPGVIFQLDLRDKRFLLRAKSKEQVGQWIKVLKQIKAVSLKGAAGFPSADWSSGHHSAYKTARDARVESTGDKIVEGKGCCVIS